MTGDDERLAFVRQQIFRAFGNPLRIYAGRQGQRNFTPRRKNFRGQRGGDLSDGAGRNPQPMIGVRPGQGQQRLDDVKPVHRILRLLNPAAPRKVADEPMRVFLGPDEIAVEREDDLRLVELEQWRDGPAEGQRRRRAMNVEIHRLVNEPARFGKPFRNQLLQPDTRRRTAAFQEEAKSFTAVGLRRL